MVFKSTLAAGILSLVVTSPVFAQGISAEGLGAPLSRAAEDRLTTGTMKRMAPKPAIPASGPMQKTQMPTGDGMLIMIRSSLLALSQANQTNNYAVLNALGSDSFRTSNPPARLSELFSAFRTNNIDLGPVTLINPQLTAQPTMVDGRLRLIGYFPSQPMQVNFDLYYEPTTAKSWKLHGLSVNLQPAKQTAAQSQAPTSR